jgi:Kef-type K+ transport system membrane component KefB
VNYQVSAGSLALSAGIALAYGLLASIVMGFAFGLINLGFLGLFLAMILGSTTGELLVRLLERVNRKRGRSVQVAVGVCYGLAAAPVALFLLSIGLIIFTIAAIATAVTRLR